ncbi:MAG: GGDEF domain-containing protein [Hyphomonadaceae bacterium]|nr:GGDEF domain-containing protein [Hyphomonadaceae bacterium]
MKDQDALLQGPSGDGIAQDVMRLMRQHNVPPSAANYQIWLAYRLGTPAPLRDVIDQRLASGDRFGPDFMADTYERFFGSLQVSGQLLIAGERIARDLEQVMAIISSAEEKNDRYGRQLESAASNLSSGLAPEQVHQIVASLAAATLDMAQHNKHLNQELHRSSLEMESMRKTLEAARVESLTDSLTGLANRRMFDETLRLRIDEARAHRTDLCLMLCDIDHFKRFNDTWGHHTGDQILRFLASAMQAHARPDFIVARYGGEEFAMIMPRTDERLAAQFGDALRIAIQAKRLRRRSTNEDLGQVTVSVGIAKLQPADTPVGFLERADACLYASKRNGRNRVTTDATPVLYVA